MRLDKFTMANSLESRAPFMDYNLVKLAYSIPVTTHMYNNQPKYLLKKISEKYLPKDLIYRKKIGFGAPIEDFFNYYEDNLEKTLKQNFMKKEFDINKFETLLQHKSNKQNHFKLWALLNYSLWYERWINDK
jgi:asparagine synthase (glutamine-hydrolysing)